MGPLATLATAVDFTDLTAGLTIFFTGASVIGLFMLGGDILLSKLGWKKR